MTSTCTSISNRACDRKQAMLITTASLASPVSEAPSSSGDMTASCLSCFCASFALLLQVLGVCALRFGCNQENPSQASHEQDTQVVATCCNSRIVCMAESTGSVTAGQCMICADSEDISECHSGFAVTSVCHGSTVPFVITFKKQSTRNALIAAHCKHYFC